MCHVAFPLQWKHCVLTFQIQPHAVGNCGGYSHTAFFRNFWAFSSCAFCFLLIQREWAALSSNRWFQLLSPLALFATKLPFFFFVPHACDNLNKESLYEHRELWQTYSKQKIIKTPAKNVWLTFIYWKLPPCKGAERQCWPEKVHHGDGEWDGRSCMVSGTAALCPRW